MAKPSIFFRRGDHVVLKRRPCCITNIICNGVGVYFACYDLFRPHVQIEAWVPKHTILLDVPIIDHRTLEKVDAYVLKRITRVTEPSLLEQIKEAHKKGSQVVLDIDFWPGNDCCVTGFSCGEVKKMEVCPD